MRDAEAVGRLSGQRTPTLHPDGRLSPGAGARSSHRGHESNTSYIHNFKQIVENEFAAEMKLP